MFDRAWTGRRRLDKVDQVARMTGKVGWRCLMVSSLLQRRCDIGRGVQRPADECSGVESGEELVKRRTCEAARGK